MQGRHMQLIQKGGGQCRHGARSLQIVQSCRLQGGHHRCCLELQPARSCDRAAKCGQRIRCTCPQIQQVRRRGRPSHRHSRLVMWGRGHRLCVEALAFLHCQECRASGQVPPVSFSLILLALAARILTRPSLKGLRFLDPAAATARRPLQAGVDQPSQLF